MPSAANQTLVPAGMPFRPAERMMPWLRLGAGIAVILMVMFGIGPLLLHLTWYKEMSRFIEAEGIRSTAIYYTDLETFSNAEFALRQNLEYGPEIRPK
ncbi:MAG: hypothetical protein KQI81_03920 [Deltaproteobacteria bacterium]|nr:hypothetical protein [Deltaproteobacteria bacterium]